MREIEAHRCGCSRGTNNPRLAHLDGVADSQDWASTYRLQKLRIRLKLRHEISSNVQRTRVTVHVNCNLYGHYDIVLFASQQDDDQKPDHFPELPSHGQAHRHDVLQNKPLPACHDQESVVLFTRPPRCLPIRLRSTVLFRPDVSADGVRFPCARPMFRGSLTSPPCISEMDRLRCLSRRPGARYAADCDAASADAREGYSNARANAVLTGVAPDVSAVRSDDVLAQVQADARAFALFGIHPSVMFNPEELLEDALPELRGYAGPGIRHGKMQDRPIPDPAFCLDTTTRTTPPAGEYFSALASTLFSTISRRTASPWQKALRTSFWTSSLTPDSSNRGPNCRTASSTSRTGPAVLSTTAAGPHRHG